MKTFVIVKSPRRRCEKSTVFTCNLLSAGCCEQFLQLVPSLAMWGILYTHNSTLAMVTVNVDIFAQLNYLASSPRRHIRKVRFLHTNQLILFDLL